MEIVNYEQTGLEAVASWIENHRDYTIDEKTGKDILRTANISFVAEGISRAQSTLLCELKDSYIQQSQRYVTLDSEGFIMPELSDDDAIQGKRLLDRCFQLYSEMSRLHEGEFKGRPKQEHYLHGIPIEDARYILPLATKTNMCMTMSGDKLYNLFELLNDQTYAPIFVNFRQKLVEYLPESILQILPGTTDGQLRRHMVQQFYQSYFDQITPDQTTVLLGAFADLDQRVGLGALTSTQQKTSSQLLAEWGAAATQKAEQVTQRVLGYGHDSIAEQARTTFGFICSLVTYHQQIRHRLPEICREDLQVLLSDQERPICMPETIRQSDFYTEFLALANDMKQFRHLVFEKYGQAAALSFLLNADQLKVIIGTNARIDIKMLADRTCMNAQWEIRQLALCKLKALKGMSKALYSTAAPSCVIDRCREGKMSCGKQREVRAMFEEETYG